MEKENKKSALSWSVGILACFSLVSSMLVNSRLALGLVAGASYRTFLAISFILIALEEVANYCSWRIDREDRHGLVRLYYAIGFIVASIITFIMPVTDWIFVIGPSLYVFTLLAKRIVAIVKNHRVYSLAYNVIFILLYVFIIILFLKIATGDIEDEGTGVIYVVCMMLILSAVVNICTVAFAKINLKVILKIIRKTYAAEILLGLMLLMIAFSLIFMTEEAEMRNFFDALWYCFTLVTTIGFGDYAATTIIGRILSVILGIYGIVVVAVITSIIVNFYNEIKDKGTEKDESAIEKPNETELVNDAEPVKELSGDVAKEEQATKDVDVNSDD